MKRGQMKRKFAVLGTFTCSGFLAISLSAVGQTQNGQTQDGQTQNAQPRNDQPQPGAPQSAPSPKADAIYWHGNIYTGELANSQFSSIMRAEAIAVRGDRIQAVGKASDMEKLKGPAEASSPPSGTQAEAPSPDGHRPGCTGRTPP